MGMYGHRLLEIDANRVILGSALTRIQRLTYCMPTACPIGLVCEEQDLTE